MAEPIFSFTCASVGLSKGIQETSFLHIILAVVSALAVSVCSCSCVLPSVNLPHHRYLSVEVHCTLLFLQVTHVIVPLLNSKVLDLSALFSIFLSNGGIILFEVWISSRVCWASR